MQLDCLTRLCLEYERQLSSMDIEIQHENVDLFILVYIVFRYFHTEFTIHVFD